MAKKDKPRQPAPVPESRDRRSRETRPAGDAKAPDGVSGTWD